MPPDQPRQPRPLDTSPDTAAPRSPGRPYFETPARAERLQLLQHLLRNAGEVVYLRAPTGAGKTLFGHRLIDTLGQDMASVWVRGGIDADIPAVVADQLGMTPDEVANWPEGALRGIGQRGLLVVVDDADNLTLPAVERLAALHAHGGRLLLLGHGGLAQTTRDWDVQFVDLPPFTVEQSAAFLHSNAGDGALHINDDLAGFLHHSAHGRPGLLLDSLDEVLARARRQAQTRQRRGGDKRKLWPWLAGGVATLVLGAALVYQDRINALFEPAATAQTPATGSTPSLIQPNPPGQDALMQPPAPTPASASAQPPAPVDAATDLQRGPVPAADSGAGVTAGTGRSTAPPVALPELKALPATATSIETAGDAADEDPLDAVMRDALSAADESAAPADSAVAQPAAAPEPARAPAVAVAAPSASTQKPATTAAAKSAPTRGLVSDGSPADRSVTPPTRQVPASVEERTAAATATSAAVQTVQRSTPAKATESHAPGEPPAAPVEERNATTPAPPTRAAKPQAPAGPAPVEERVAAAVDKPVAAKPAVASGKSELDVLKRVYVAPATGGSAWLKSREPGRYTLQLVGARDRAAVEKFVRVHKVAPPFAIFERSLSGRPWYSLVAGDYADRGAALAARDRLPAALAKSDIWPRTFASVQESLE